MILESKKTHIAYRCPGCGYSIFGFVGSFSVSAQVLRLKCQCGESELVITPTQDKKMRLSVPCLFCGKPHGYTVTQSLFFGSELFMLNCPNTNMDICFIGKKDKIDEALENSGAEIKQLIDQLGMEEENTEAPTPEQLLPDAQIYDILRFVVKELEAENKIACPCHKGPYELDITEDGVRVFCVECGASYVFVANSVASAQGFLDCDGLTLSYTP